MPEGQKGEKRPADAIVIAVDDRPMGTSSFPKIARKEG